MATNGVRRAIAIAAWLCGCAGNVRPGPQPDSPACREAETTLAEARRFREQGLLGRALRAVESAARTCPSRPTQLEHARALADLGLDESAIAAWQTWANSGDDSDRRRAATEIAALRRRPRPDRVAPPDDSARALALYRDGVDRRLAGKPDLAVTQLRRSYALRPHPLTIVQIALAHRAAGRDVEYRAACARALAIAELLAGTKAIPVARLGHRSPITAVSADEGSRWLASGDDEGTVLVWELASGRILHQLTPHKSPVAALQLSRDGRRLVSASGDGEVRVWDVATGALARSFAVARGPVAIDDDAARIAAGRSAIQLWDASTGAASGAPLPAPGGAVNVLAFQPGGSLLAAGGTEVAAWDLAAAGAPVRTFGPRSMDVRMLSFSEDGRLLVAVLGDGSLVAWSSGDGRPAAMQAPPSRKGISVAVDAATNLGASRGDESRLLAWDLGTGKPRAIEHVTDQVTTVRFTPLDHRLIVGDYTGVVAIVDLSGATVTRKLGHRLPARTELAMDTRAGYLATSGHEPVIDLWSLGNATTLRRLRGKLPVGSLGFADDGRALVSAGLDYREEAGEISHWRTADGSQLRTDVWYHLRRVHPITSDALLVLAKNAWGNRQPVLSHGEVFRKLPAQTDVEALAVSSDGTRLAYAGLGFLAVGGLDGEPKVVEFVGNGHAVAFEPGGRWVAVGSDARVDLRDANDGALLRSFPVPDTGVYRVAYSPGGDQIVASGSAAEQYIAELHWIDAATGARTTSRSPHGVLTWLAYDHTGARLFTTGFDGTVGVWNAPTRQLLGRLIATERGWMVLATDGAVDGDLDDAEQTALLQWQAGNYQLPGFVGWQREHTPGLAARLLPR